MASSKKKSSSGARLCLSIVVFCAFAAVARNVTSLGGPLRFLRGRDEQNGAEETAGRPESESDPRKSGSEPTSEPAGGRAAENELAIELGAAGGERDGVATTEVQDMIDARSDKPQHKKLLTALHWFDRKAAALNITYALAYGSLLGQVRGGDVISHDTDADVEMGTDAIAKLLQAMGEGDDDIYDQANHSEIPISRPVMLVRLHNHNLTFDRVERFDCRGVKQAGQTDGCAFTGPLGRVMLGWHAYVDLYYRCSFVENAPKSWHCRTSTMDCSYCMSGQALPTLPFTPVPCKFGPVTTRCPPESYAHDRLRGVYGDTYMTPDKR